MINFKLQGNKAFQWSQKDKYYFIGYFFDENNEIFEGEKAINFLLNFEKTNSKIKKFNGIYTYIKITANAVIIISDSINYFPLFYLKQNDDWIVSDDWNYLINIKGKILPNLEAETEFLSIGFVLDNETVDKDILKTRAGEMVSLNNNGTFERLADYYFLPEYFLDNNFQELNDLIVSDLYEAGKRLIKFLDSRTAVIPLSGGFDSRLIACILKKFNYENVICFTYGLKNKEEKISRKVAQNLEYKWYFIDYAEIELKTYIDDPQFLEYIKFIGNGYSMPYLQEYFAVKKLVNDNLIPKNSVLLPGHTGDYIAGSYILKAIKTNIQNDKLDNWLINNYFSFRKNTKKETKQLIKRLSKVLNKYPIQNNYSKNYNPYIEDWDIKEKFSKFIFHSSKVFDFFGYETYFFLWDKKIVDFFRNLPYKFRENKLLYDYVAINEFFIKNNVYFQEKEMIVSPLDLKIQKFKNKIRDFFPWKYTLKRMAAHDWRYYAVLTSKMEDKMEEKGYKRLKNFRYFNAIICRWYLDFVKYYDQNIKS